MKCISGGRNACEQLREQARPRLQVADEVTPEGAEFGGLDLFVDVGAQPGELHVGAGVQLVAETVPAGRGSSTVPAPTVGETSTSTRWLPQVDRLVDVVGDEQDGDAERCHSVADQVLQVGPGLCVDGGERLVHQQHARLVGERAGDRDALLHAAGELPGMGAVRRRRAPPRPAPRRPGARARARARFFSFSGSSTFCRTVIQGNRLRPYSWNTTAMPSGGPVTGSPSSTTSPEVGASSPATHCSSVVLPQPDGPTTQTNSPAGDREGEVAIASTLRPSAVVDLAQALRIVEHRRLLPVVMRLAAAAQAVVPAQHAALDQAEQERQRDPEQAEQDDPAPHLRDRRTSAGTGRW